MNGLCNKVLSSILYMFALPQFAHTTDCPMYTLYIQARAYTVDHYRIELKLPYTTNHSYS